MQIPTSNTSVSTNRNSLLDTYRGAAVFLMIIFHFCWDLREFGYIDYKLNDTFWVLFRSVILFLFLTAIGWSAYLSQRTLTNRQHKIRRFLLRQRKLLIASTAISLATYVFFPNQWIYFGILHFILIVNFIHYPFASYPIISAAIGALIGTLYYLTDLLLFPSIYGFITESLGAPKNTLDIIYPFPWVACVFIGPIFGKYIPNNALIASPYLIYIFAWLGRHALNVYLLHQIILYSLVSLIYNLLN
ncbi:heparan-alpha-glucosaminide N-acetyltransferase [Marinomonas sp. 2405UD68-3]|uniref:heparan-alpha-glucosaminide N-acetyltransferase n=1 Tax=Marinomonas sp. 2405UD68-3 TaxID=3391835 RepID=UPI0039C9B38F